MGSSGANTDGLMSKPMRWGDEDEDLDSINFPSTFSTKPDENGIKTVTEYVIENGVKLKIVEKIKTSQREVRVPKAVLRRRNLSKFGAVSGLGPGPEKGVTTVNDLYELILTPKMKVEQKASGDALSNMGKGSVVMCRTCGKIGEHWTKDCPYKDDPEALARIRGDGNASIGGSPAATGPTSAESSPSGTGLATRTEGAYIPPGLRAGAAAAGGPAQRRAAQSDEATLRVSNLPPETTEPDVRDLFSNFGRLHRVYLARDRNSDLCKGFAFINYAEREHAARAIQTLNGYGYGHLILRVEWAKPSNN